MSNVTKQPIRLGYIDLSFHLASAAVVKEILERHGHAVELRAAPHEAMFELLHAKEVDIVSSAWLPASHGAYLAPSLDVVEKLTVLYEPYCLWGVPDYVPADVLASVDDLKKPEVLEQMDRVIDGINPGAGISRFSAAMITAYGLDEAGYRFVPGSEATSFAKFERAVAERRWLVLPLWSPQYLHHDYRIRSLAEPKGMLGGQDQATLVARKAVLPDIAPAALDELRGLYLGNDVVTDLEHAIRVEGLSAQQAARRWLDGQRVAA
jgi:glycine betaine/proline transport system substrate-binding protein